MFGHSIPRKAYTSNNGMHIEYAVAAKPGLFCDKDSLCVTGQQTIVEEVDTAIDDLFTQFAKQDGTPKGSIDAIDVVFGYVCNKLAADQACAVSQNCHMVRPVPRL